MAALQGTTHPSLTVDCPVCGRPLPPVVVDADARTDVDPGSRPGRVLNVELTLQELDAAWWAAARAAHPDCIPPDDPERRAA